MINYQGDHVKPGMQAPDEKEMNDPEEHGEGTGTEQAGTGDAEGQVPDRKDMHEKFVKPKKYTDEGFPLKVMAGAGEEDSDYMEEAFELFKEEIDLDEADDLDSDDLRV
jgi:hypothetical protein